MLTRGFTGRECSSDQPPLPPGQHVLADFPVKPAGPRGRTSEVVEEQTSPVPNPPERLHDLFLPAQQHPLRERALTELHARPASRIESPCSLAVLAIASPFSAREDEVRCLQTLAERLQVAPPSGLSDEWHAEFGINWIVWERHAAFSAYHFGNCRAGQANVAEVLGSAAEVWLRSVPGELAAAVRINVIEHPDEIAPTDVARACGSDDYVGAHVMSERASVWTDLRPHSDGFVRIVVINRKLDSRETGRLVQRLSDIECYRTFALLALPLAAEVNAALDKLDAELDAITTNLPRFCASEDRARALGQIIELASAGEALAGRAASALSGALAYGDIVRERLAELREQRIEERATLSDFIGRRFGPALRTIGTANERLRSFENLVARTAELLRTAVQVSVEHQNQNLLASLDGRAQLQLRLQQTVEGLSVVVISYYVVGLGVYLVKGFEKAGVVPEVPGFLVAGAAPILIALVWLFLFLARERHRRQAA